MGGYLTVSEPEKMKGIISGKAIIPALDGSGKMSKSGGNKNAIIFLDDDLETIRKKVAKIPSTPKHWHIFFHLNWLTLTDKEKEQLLKDIAEDIKQKLKKYESKV